MSYEFFIAVKLTFFYHIEFITTFSLYNYVLTYSCSFLIHCINNHSQFMIIQGAEHKWLYQSGSDPNQEHFGEIYYITYP